jgi:hypothetical protein
MVRGLGGEPSDVVQSNEVELFGLLWLCAKPIANRSSGK